MTVGPALDSRSGVLTSDKQFWPIFTMREGELWAVTDLGVISLEMPSRDGDSIGWQP